jgi:hypothetical protein
MASSMSNENVFSEVGLKSYNYYMFVGNSSEIFQQGSTLSFKMWRKPTHFPPHQCVALTRPHYCGGSLHNLCGAILLHI